MRHTDLSVVVPTFNRDRYLLTTLEHLCRQRNAAFEILVVDQNEAAVDDRAPELQRFARMPGIRWIASRRGVVYGRNLAVSQAEGGVLVFVDDDVEIPDTDFLAKHASLHADEPTGTRLAAVCGREMNPGGPPLVDALEYRRTDAMADILHFPRNYARRIEATVLSTANCSIRRDALLDVGGFDERFAGASYGDDSDLALRLRHSGYRIVYDPNPALVHLLAPIGGLRMSDRASTFSSEDRVLSAVVFYMKHVRSDYPRYRAEYLLKHVLRRSLLLRRNVTHPWLLPGAFMGLARAYLAARSSIRSGHVWSFEP